VLNDAVDADAVPGRVEDVLVVVSVNLVDPLFMGDGVEDTDRVPKGRRAELFESYLIGAVGPHSVEVAVAVFYHIQQEHDKCDGKNHLPQNIQRVDELRQSEEDVRDADEQEHESSLTLHVADHQVANDQSDVEPHNEVVDRVVVAHCLQELHHHERHSG